jgi:two-component system cell cycle response regulator CtrA
MKEFNSVSFFAVEKMSDEQLRAHVRSLQDRVEQLEYLLLEIPKHDVKFKFCHLTPTEERYLGMVYTQSFVCTKEAILIGVYGGLPECDVPEMKIIDVIFCKIRKKLKPFGVQIETIWGRGYFLDPENRAKMRALIVASQDIVAPLAGVLRKAG